MHAINQGVRGAEPTTVEIFLKTVHIKYSKIPGFVGSRGKFWKNLLFTIKDFRWNFTFYYIFMDLGIKFQF